MRFVAFAIALAACSSPSKPAPAPVEPAPAPVEPTPGEPAPAPLKPAPVEPAPSPPLASEPPAIDAAAPAAPPVPVLFAEGIPCVRDGECASNVCEGQGCSDEDPGRCAPEKRGCTKDLRSYCGCDGKTFKSSGSCPRRRYEAKGACPTGANRKVGAFCLKGNDCASKVCEGEGCADDKPGRCADAKRACTADVVRFCACDGKSVTGSSSCPGVRYAKRGGCDDTDD